MARRKYTWEKLSDEQLLKQRLSSLRVTVEGTWLEDCLGTLNEELQARGIRLRPQRYLQRRGTSVFRGPSRLVIGWFTVARSISVRSE